jgi:hypothetical protein
MSWPKYLKHEGYHDAMAMGAKGKKIVKGIKTGVAIPGRFTAIVITGVSGNCLIDSAVQNVEDPGSKNFVDEDKTITSHILVHGGEPWIGPITDVVITTTDAACQIEFSYA